MRRHLEATIENFPIAGLFTISRGSKTEAEVVSCTITENGMSGRGECVPYKRYGETVDAVLAEIRALGEAICEGMDRHSLQAAMKPGAARNAVDCALWDLEARLAGRSVAAALELDTPHPIVTAFTLSLAEQIGRASCRERVCQYV